jgi:hypothetical protein
MPEACIDCIFCDARRSMCLVNSGIGEKKEDKWSCSRCGTPTFVGHKTIPQKGKDIGNNHRDNRQV